MGDAGARDEAQDDLAQLAAVAAGQLRGWQTAGVRRMTRGSGAEPAVETSPPVEAAVPTTTVPVAAVPVTSVPVAAAPVAATIATDVPVTPPPVVPAAGGGERESLDAVATAMDGCMRCALGATRTNLVFGVGNPRADVVFVGEAPGRDEDLKGEPFVGRAGQLLTDIIEKGMKLPRASVYICNTVKCRPPENRNPEAAELAACEPFLIRQLAAIRPRVIVALGKFAAQSLCRSEAPISRLRGNWHTYEGIKIMPTYHPAYLLRNPSAKREVWEDIRLVMAELGMSGNKNEDLLRGDPQ
ncbi:MAG: uracil-DNA glycosylase [Nitrospirota bacterium]|nr:uracil-DNA glycosylase [Nitrospirota bacterium]